MVQAHFELGRHVSVSGGDTEEEAVEFGKGLRSSNRVVGLRRGIHLGQDLLGKGFGDPVTVVRSLEHND